MYKIYVISDLKTGYPRYVGKTIQPLHQRLAQHLGTERDTLVSDWYRKQLSVCNTPVISVLAISNKLKEALELEKFWIKKLAKTFNILNKQHNPNYRFNDDHKKVFFKQNL